MSNLSVSIKPNPNSLARAFARGNVTKFLQREISRLAFSVERYAKQLTPVDTGILKSSIHTQAQNVGLAAKVSTNTNYAIFVHDGTKYMKSRPFMTMGAAFAQVAELKDINKRLDADFANQFKSLR